MTTALQRSEEETTMKQDKRFKTVLASWAVLALAACGGGGADDSTPTAAAASTQPTETSASFKQDLAQALGPRSLFNHRPDFVRGEVRSTEYDGVTDDLLTAGL